MKQETKYLSRFISAAAGMSLAWSVSVASAAQNVQLLPSGIQTNGLSSDENQNDWGTFWITTPTAATCTWSFDSTMQSDPSIPGSIYCVCDWNGTAGSDINFGADLPNGDGTWLGNPSVQVIDGTQYSALMMDIYWNLPNITNMTTWGAIELMTPSYGQVALTNNIPIPTNAGWQHLVIPINPTLPNLSSIAGVALYTWLNAGPPTHAEFWVDNVQLVARAVAIPPPTLTLSPIAPTPGLNIQTATTDGEYDRQSVATVSANYSWVGAGSTPVTYSMTVTNYPGSNNLYFQAQIYLASGGPAGMPGYGNAPDWGAPNCIFLQIQNTPGGAGQGSLLLKTNEPGGNSMFWNAAYNPIALINDPAGPNGTWTISFVNDTNVTLTSPSGLTANGSFPDDTALQTDFPQGSTVAYFGATPNATSNPGQGLVITEVKITGPASDITPIDDFFTEFGLNTAIWSIQAAEPGDITVVPANVHWLVDWTLPALNFQLQSAASVAGPWSSFSLATNAAQKGQVEQLMVPDSFLPATSTGFFRLLKPVATQLQVLLPGESNAPGTPTGKTGTPTPESSYIPFDITVNACDSDWNIVTICQDTVAFTSTDTAASLPMNTPLVNGTLTITGQTYFGTLGTWTITASDVTSSAVSNGVSTPITITQ